MYVHIFVCVCMYACIYMYIASNYYMHMCTRETYMAPTLHGKMKTHIDIIHIDVDMH
jgi:hypothetical protein